MTLSDLPFCKEFLFNFIIDGCHATPKKKRQNSQKLVHRFVMSVISVVALLFAFPGALVHGLFAHEWFLPRHVLWLIYAVFPPFFKFKMPNKETDYISPEEYQSMWDAFVGAVPEEKQETAKDVVFLLGFEQRQSSLGFTAVAVGAIYGFTLPLEQRSSLHLIIAVVAVFMTLSHLIQGLNLNGWNTPRGKVMALQFGPLFLAAAILNFMAFFESRAAADL